MEKQLRKLFCFLVYQHPTFSDNNIERVIKVIAENTEPLLPFLHQMHR